MVELLSPAGNFISLRAVLENGADATYFGLDDFNMRANAKNFSLNDLSEVSKIAKEYSAKTYLCSNVVLNEDRAMELKNNLGEIAASEIDGIILSDIGLIEDVVGNGLEAHISVQENISNSFILKTLKRLGAKRAILSRELSLEDIKKTVKNSPIETEVFIHGAMCMAISGRCFLSSGLYGRSANCGDCLQPCRKYIMNAKDLCMIHYIPELVKSGIYSFKIEGRARSPDYGAMVTDVYRQAIDKYYECPKEYKINPQWVEELKSVFNRGFDTGFYFNTPFETSENNQSKFIKKDIGQVVNYFNKVKVAELKIWDDLAIGDEILIQGKTTGSIKHKIDSMQINGENVENVEKGNNVGVAIPTKVREHDFVYKLVKR